MSKLLRFITPAWYGYMFSFDDNYCLTEKVGIIWCRIRMHPNGPVWFTPGGLEPDMHCKDCGEGL